MGPTEVDAHSPLPIQEISPSLQKYQFQYFGNLQNNNNNHNNVNSTQSVVDAPIQPQQQGYSPAASSSASQRQLRSEALRLATFQGWPLDYLPPRELASSGFFYCGIADQTRCAFCYITISQWEPEDSPAVEHRRHAPNCPFVLGLPVGNIPLSSVTGGSGSPPGISGSRVGLGPERSSSSSGQPQPAATLPSTPVAARPPFLLATLSTSGGDTCARFANESRPNAIPERAMTAGSTLSIRPPLPSELQGPSTSSSSLSSSSLSGVLPHQQARRPELTSLEARLNTFADWPPGLEQRPAQLAEAGFYYMKTGDHVKCFCCDGALRNWEPKDDPWVEHARWFSRCNFLVSVKGEDYVKEVKARFQQPNPAAAAATTTNPEDIAEMKRESPSKDDSPRSGSPSALTTATTTGATTLADQTQSPNSKLKDALLCQICCDQQLSMVFLPCGHSMSCPSCATALTTCPLCRKRIEATVRAYFPFSS